MRPESERFEFGQSSAPAGLRPLPVAYAELRSMGRRKAPRAWRRRGTKYEAQIRALIIHKAVVVDKSIARSFLALLNSHDQLCRYRFSATKISGWGVLGSVLIRWLGEWPRLSPSRQYYARERVR